MTPEELSMIKNLEEKWGKSLQEWIGIVKNSGLQKHGEILKLLKSEHGLTHGYANMIAHKAKGSDAGSVENTDTLVEAQYAGDKQSLKPIYDQLITYLKSIGNDVEIAPKKTYVSIRRKKQFALIQPTTKTRIDLGINLKGAEPKGKLEASGSFNSMVSHRVKLEKAGDVDKEVKDWLKAAYDQA